MRPIKLKIKGLNSFIEEQTIDFEKLTSRGMFGIFGPTGSGKSTILDAITLALYGEISRKSSNFINTNCKTCNVSFEFQISGKQIKRYKVSREYKRDKKNESILSSKCRIVDITCGEVVLADKVRDVNDKCKEILGLSIDDFTRTVVLPQGKFSEFLKLEGKNRREMLERLFNLEKYGDELSSKLSNALSKVRTDKNLIDGEMKGYESYSKDKLEELEQKMNDVNIEYQKISKEWNEISQKDKEINEIWNNKNELNKLLKIKKTFIEIQEEIEIKRKKVLNSERAGKIVPFISQLKDNTLSLDNLKSYMDKINKNLLEKNKLKNVIETKWKNLKELNDKELPNLKVKEDNYKDALIQEEELKKYSNEIEKLINFRTELVNRNKDLNDKLSYTQSYIDKNIEKEKDMDIQIENLKVDSDLREKIQQGTLLMNNYKLYRNQFDELTMKLNEIIDKDNELTFKKDNLKELSINLEQISEGNNKLCNQDDLSEKDLLDFQQQILKCKESLKNKNNLIAQRQQIEEQLSDNKNKLKEFTHNKDIIEEKKNSVIKELEDMKIDFYASFIRERLVDDKPCPVCGNIHRINNNIIDKENDNRKIEEYKKEKEKLEKEDMDISLKISIIDKTIQDKEKELKSIIENINDNLKDVDMELEKSLKDKNKLKSNLNNLLCKIEKLKIDTATSDFEKKNKELLVSEDKRNELIILKNKIKEKNDNFNKNKLNIIEQISRLDGRIEKGNALIDEKQIIINNKKSYLIQKLNIELKDNDSIGNIVNVKLQEVKKKIESLETEYSAVEMKKDNICKELESLNSENISAKSKINEKVQQNSKLQLKIESLIKEEKFNSADDALKAFLEGDEKEKLTLEIQSYDTKFAENEGAIKKIKSILKGRDITEEEYNQFNEIKKEKNNCLNIKNEERIKCIEEYKNVKNKIEQLTTLIQKRDKLNHKYSLLIELEKLFKGKRFIEYVATSRLAYISVEASKRLYSITNGNYGLEVNEDGKFFIRDFKNGGVSRDTSTLSGGETFLASLALALSLSAEIQLKGTAPLELFFLDEGFGTLDDDLLETVISSLERIHNDKLKIGIISHVDSIKNRVPVKLLVTESKSGISGSKISIEYN